eukprot:Gb_17861 [translate_table: standard]
MAASASAFSIAPQTILFLAVIGVILVVPFYGSLMEQLEEISPAMVMAAPVVLVIIIKCLSSDRNISSYFFNDADPSSIHRVGGSPVGVALVLLMVLLMIWYQSSGEDDSED